MLMTCEGSTFTLEEKYPIKKAETKHCTPLLIKIHFCNHIVPSAVVGIKRVCTLCKGRLTKACGLGGLFKVHSIEL